MIELYVKQVMAGRTRAERRAILRQVPYHIRDKVRAMVEHKWQQRDEKRGRQPENTANR